MSHEFLIDDKGRLWCADDCPADLPHWKGGDGITPDDE